MVTPSKVVLLTVTPLLSRLINTEFLSVALLSVEMPPTPNEPPPPISSSAPTMSSTPVTLSVVPVERVNRTPLIDAPVNEPSSVKLPDCRSMFPVLVQAWVAAGLIDTVAPFTTTLPVLTKGAVVVLLGVMLSVPAVAFTVPALLNTDGLMVKVCPALLAAMMPLLTSAPL